VAFFFCLTLSVGSFDPKKPVPDMTYNVFNFSGFNVPLNIIGHIGDGFLRVKWPGRQCQSTEGSSVLRTRLQSHQVHLTMLQYYTCMQYTVIQKN